MKFRTIAATAAACALAGAAVLAQAQTAKPHDTAKSHEMQHGPVTMKARAEIKGEGVSGTAEFEEMSHGAAKVVHVTLTVSGLKPGLHGVHLHAVGKCEPPAFTAAGGHFDPGPAGNTDPDANHPYHMGDIPNVEAGKDGKGTLKAVTTRVTLSEGPLSLFDADGTAIIVHANPDKGITGETKSGVSGGPRVACGVVKK